MATINVATPGLHTLNLWMREDGLEVDKVVLTTDADLQYAPEDIPMLYRECVGGSWDLVQGWRKNYREKSLLRKLLSTGFSGILRLLFFLPLLTMRLFAEERRSGTLEVLLTSPLSEAEVDRILGRISAPEEGKETLEIPYNVGDSVQVMDGPFSEWIGVINEINHDKGKLKVMISIFGSETPVELDFLQVKPV